MPNLLFRGTYIRFYDVRYDEKSKTVYTKINLTADFSEPVRESMEWGMPPAGFASASLDGEIAASKMVLRPNMRQHKESTLTLEAREAGSFEVVRVTDKKTDATHNELRFQITTVDPLAPQEISNYLGVIGKGVGALSLTFQEQTSSGTAEEDGVQGKLIDDAQAADTATDDDDKSGGSVASVTEMKRKRGKEVN